MDIDPVPQGGPSHGILDKKKIVILILHKVLINLIKGEDMLNPKVPRHAIDLGI